MLIVAALVWAASLPLAAFAVSHAGAASALSAIGFLVYAVGSVVCHQLPQRSFHLWATQLPVCARCTGLYAGAALAAVAAAPAAARRIVDSASRVRWLLLLAAVPTLASLAFEWTTGVMPSNVIRAACGLPLGAAISWVLMEGVR